MPTEYGPGFEKSIGSALLDVEEPPACCCACDEQEAQCKYAKNRH
jgi:hypothetical protein